VHIQVLHHNTRGVEVGYTERGQSGGLRLFRAPETTSDIF
jgi:hypothetical protein